jgi:ATP phosphoribosyltransferase regulatory subunit
MLDALRLAGLAKVRLDLCHAGVLAALIDAEPAAPALGRAAL